jgi:biopolymer transport protein ExbD
MAEIQNSPGNSSRKIRSKKVSTRVDFTPMVDLGFLLITFFMLTTTLAKPQLMALVMPDKESDAPPAIIDRKVLTLLLGANDKVYWYEGLTDARLDSTNFSGEGLRRVILEKMKEVEGQYGLENYQDLKTKAMKKGSHLNVLIKPTNESRFQNLVDALDEMAVCRVRYYMILDISEQEKDFIKNPSNGLNFNSAQQLQTFSR